MHLADVIRLGVCSHGMNARHSQVRVTFLISDHVLDALRVR